MPVYEYKCLKCKKEFSTVESITEHGTRRVSCPGCGSTAVEQIYRNFFAKTSKKS